MGDEAAGIGPGQRAPLAGVAQGEHEVVRPLRMQDGAELGRNGLPRHGEEGEEKRVGPLASGKRGASQRGLHKERKRVAGRLRNALMHIGCGHSQPPVHVVYGLRGMG